MKLRNLFCLWLLLAALVAPRPANAAIFGLRVAQTTPVAIGSVYFIGKSGSVTATGFLTDSNGVQTGSSFTGTISSSTPTSLATLYGAALPTATSGVYLTLSNTVYFAITASTTDFAANPSNYPQLSSTTYLAFGRATSPSIVSSGGGGTASNVNVTNASLSTTQGTTPWITNGYSKFTTYPATEGSNTVTNSAAALTVTTVTTPLFDLLTNTGTVDAWASPISGGHTWLIPAGSTVAIPFTGTVYGLSTSASSTTLYAIEVGA
jgi:hypothetical protein